MSANQDYGHSAKCPADYAIPFTAAWKAGVPMDMLQRSFTKPDDSLYSHRTLRGWAFSLGLETQRAKSAKLTNSPDVTAQESIESEIRNQRSKMEEAAYEAERRRLLKEAASNQAVIQTLRDEMPRLQPTLVKRFKEVDDPELADETVLAFISDVQLGERVERIETSGLGYYDLDCFHERLERYYTAVSRLIKMHRSASKITKLHIAFGGDIVEGSSIYPSQAFHIDIPAIPQTLVCVEAFSDMLSQLAALDLDIEIYGVPGNHGRIARKGTEPYMNNLDTLVYHGMRWRLENHPRIRWHISDSWLQLFRIKGHLFAMEHGDMVRGTLGVPLYGLIRRAGRLLATVGPYKGGIIEYHLIGHHHTPVSAETGFGIRSYINGSWVGGSNYSVQEMGLSSVPSQLLLGINQSHGVVWERNVYLSSAAEIRQLPVVEAD